MTRQHLPPYIGNEAFSSRYRQRTDSKTLLLQDLQRILQLFQVCHIQ